MANSLAVEAEPVAPHATPDDDRFLCFDTTEEWLQSRQESLTPEERAAELDEAADYMGSDTYYKVVGDHVVPEHWDVEDGEPVWKPPPNRWNGRTVRLRPILPLHLRARVRARSSRRSRVLRVRVRGSSSSRDRPPGEPDLEDLPPPGVAGRVGVLVAT